MMDSRFVYAVTVAREGSFTRAAQRLGITQPAITRSISELEKRIGYQLFNRTARGVLLTPAGREFTERAARLIEDARELIAGPLSRDPFNGPLRIGVCPASLEWLLVKPLSDLLQKHSSIRFELISGNIESVVQQLRAGAVDVALGFDAAFREWPDLARHKIAAFRPVMFVRAGHPLLALHSVSNSDLLDYEMISPSDSQVYGKIMREMYNSRGEDWRQRLHIIDYFPIVRQIVATSNTIGSIADNPATIADIGDRFAIIRTTETQIAASMCCATRSRWTPRPSAKAFIRVMQKFLPPTS